MAATKNDPRPPAAEATQARSRVFEYVFPAIRGVQAGREYYVTMCPLRLIPRLFVFDEEELMPELRAQRTLNKARVPEIARYILDNPKNYVFSALTASVDAEVHFEPAGAEGSQERVGTLMIPMSAKFVINDGQHRRAAIQAALIDNPQIGDESIAIVMFLDLGLDRCQQMFADLNRHAVRPAKSIGVLYDHRDELAQITKLVVLRSPLLHDLTETETSNLAIRSRKLFTLSAIFTATKALLDGSEAETFERRVDLATRFWEVVSQQFPEWRQVFSGDVRAGEVRKEFIHSHGIVLHAVGLVGSSLVSDGWADDDWGKLMPLSAIDWRRANPAWEGRALVGGRVSKSTSNVLLTTAAIRTALGMPLPPEEQRAEDALTAGAK